MTVSGIAMVGGAAGIGALVLAGVMSGPVGWAALGTLGAVVAVISVITVIGAIIESGKERDELRDTINNLCNDRLKLQVQIQKIDVLIDWLARFGKQGIRKPRIRCY